MKTPHLLVIAIDGLRASALGCYGNTWYETPALNRLAAEGVVFDWYYANSVALEPAMQALWQGLHPLRPEAVRDQATNFPTCLRELGYRTAFVTDDASFEPHPIVAEFDETCIVPLLCDEMPESVDETNTFRTLIQASEVLSGFDDSMPQALWVQLSAIQNCWDAPLELVHHLLDEEEEDGEEDENKAETSLAKTSSVPNEAVDTNNPDATFHASCRYAAQVIALDHCLAAMFDLLEQLEIVNETTVVLTGVRGFSLGEHGTLGTVPEQLFSEQLQVPLVIRFANQQHQLQRTSQLAQSIDLLPTLLELCQQNNGIELPLVDGHSLIPQLNNKSTNPSERVLSTSTTGEISLRTNTWQCRVQANEQPELYLKPDDRWEINNIASRLPGISEDIDNLAAEMAKAYAGTSPVAFDPLPEDLTTRPD